jgi:hypothetical protein
MTGRVLLALAAADFRERTRRPGYLVTLATAVVLGYLALPPATSQWVIMDAGGYRGVYNSAYAATATALAGSLWLMLGGFYVVRSAIARDQHTGVGQILAATPLSRAGYLAGKFCSNLLVLASLAGVLAVTAVVLQLARGESWAVDPGPLLLPFVLFTLPVLAVTAAVAVLFETVPVLRAGVGNIAWFFLGMFLAIGGGGVPLGGLGTVAASMRAALAAQHLPAAAEFSVGFTKVDQPLRTFTWAGLHPSGGFVTGRLILLLAAACLALVPALWFGRFDPARTRPRRATPDRGATSGATLVPGSVAGSGADRTPTARRSLTLAPLPARTRPRLAFRRLLAGEVRILVQGTSRWWWLVAVALNVAGLAVPANGRSGRRPTDRRLGGRRRVHPLARPHARRPQPYPPHVPGHLRHLVVRHGQPGRRRRLHGHRPRPRPSGRAVAATDRRGHTRHDHRRGRRAGRTACHPVTVRTPGTFREPQSGHLPPGEPHGGRPRGKLRDRKRKEPDRCREPEASQPIC